MGMTLDELEKKLAEATGPSATLNYRVWTTLVAPNPSTSTAIRSEQCLYCGTGAVLPPPPYTSSLDAAVALCEAVLPGADWNVGRDKIAYLITPKHPKSIISEDTSAATPALAICLAIIRALKAEREKK